jgi:hypothetical protein
MPVGASLHIGLNAVDPKEYSGWDGQLTACEFDANDMQALAKTQGFTKVTKRLTKKGNTQPDPGRHQSRSGETETERHFLSDLFGARRPGAEHGERF